MPFQKSYPKILNEVPDKAVLYNFNADPAGPEVTAPEVVNFDAWPADWFEQIKRVFALSN